MLRVHIPSCMGKYPIPYLQIFFLTEILSFLNFQCSLLVLHEGLPSVQERVLPTGSRVERILLRSVRLLLRVLAESSFVLRRLLSQYNEELHEKRE